MAKPSGVAVIRSKVFFLVDGKVRRGKVVDVFKGSFYDRRIAVEANGETYFVAQVFSSEEAAEAHEDWLEAEEREVFFLRFWRNTLLQSLCQKKWFSASNLSQ